MFTCANTQTNAAFGLCLVDHDGLVRPMSSLTKLFFCWEKGRGAKSFFTDSRFLAILCTNSDIFY